MMNTRNTDYSLRGIRPKNMVKKSNIQDIGQKIVDKYYYAPEAKKKADYLSSPKGLVKETIKGLPEAAKKVGSKILESGAMGGAVSALKKATKVKYPKRITPIPKGGWSPKSKLA